MRQVHECFLPTLASIGSGTKMRQQIRHISVSAVCWTIHPSHIREVDVPRVAKTVDPQSLSESR